MARAPSSALRLAAGALFLAATPPALSAQQGPGELPPLVGDRPDFTESAVVVSRVQLESGYSLQEGAVDEHTLGEVLVRVPATRWLEIRLVPGSYLARTDSPGTPSGFDDAAAGVKLRLAEVPGSVGAARPAAALLLSSTLPTGEVSEAGPQPEARLALGWELGGGLSLGTNVGVAVPESDDDRFAQLLSSLALGASLGGGAGLFVEGYGIVPAGPGGRDEGYVNAGLTYLLTEDFQVDVRGGAGVAGSASDAIFGVGIVRRF